MLGETDPGGHDNEAGGERLRRETGEHEPMFRRIRPEGEGQRPMTVGAGRILILPPLHDMDVQACGQHWTRKCIHESTDPRWLIRSGTWIRGIVDANRFPGRDSVQIHLPHAPPEIAV